MFAAASDTMIADSLSSVFPGESFVVFAAHADFIYPIIDVQLRARANRRGRERGFSENDDVIDRDGTETASSGGESPLASPRRWLLRRLSQSTRRRSSCKVNPASVVAPTT